MQKLMNVSLAIAVLAIASFSSCSKGAKGDTGATGATGAAGPDSVYYSNWTNVSMTGGVDSQGDSTYSEGISASVITQGIIDSGLVITYVGVNAGGSDITDIEPADNYMETDISIGAIYLISYNGDLTGDFAFRYVVIPGSVLTTDAAWQGLSKTQIRALSYDQVNQKLGNKLSTKVN